MIVVFDVCDGDFRFYNDYEFNKKMAIWRKRLIDDRFVARLDAEDISDEDVFDCIHGDECWYAEVPTDI